MGQEEAAAAQLFARFLVKVGDRSLNHSKQQSIVSLSQSALPGTAGAKVSDVESRAFVQVRGPLLSAHHVDRSWWTVVHEPTLDRYLQSYARHSLARSCATGLDVD